MLLVGLGCGESTGVDAGSNDAAAQDAGRDAGRDAGPDGRPDAGAMQWTRITTTDGAVLEGELIASYDHSIFWWSPSDETTFALFDPRALAPWPDDDSTHFIGSREIEMMTPLVRPAGLASHRDTMRERGVVLERVPLDGVAHVLTGGERYHLEENGYGHFAWDLVVHDDADRRHSGDGLANADYYVWDREVRLPTGGVVVEVVRDAPDLPPGPVDLDAVNNLVGVQIYGGRYLYLLHLRQDSVPAEVVVGARLETGALIGRVGNSGVTAEPHLHVVSLAYDDTTDPPRTWSVPAEWRDVWIGSRRPTRQAWAVPVGGEDVSNEAF